MMLGLGAAAYAQAPPRCLRSTTDAPAPWCSRKCRRRTPPRRGASWCVTSGLCERRRRKAIHVARTARSPDDSADRIAGRRRCARHGRAAARPTRPVAAPARGAAGSANAPRAAGQRRHRQRRCAGRGGLCDRARRHRSGPRFGRGRIARARVGGSRDGGNARFEVWQQLDRPNHFTCCRLAGENAHERFVQSDAARKFRAAVAPSIGSLYDERRYQRVE